MNRFFNFKGEQVVSRERESVLSTTDDWHVKGYMKLMSPNQLQGTIPITEKARKTVIEGRCAIADILEKNDKRLLVIAGPCSVHDEKAAMDYAGRLAELSSRVSDQILIVMRVYFEKPRTSIGWKGLINDPCMDGSCNMSEGLQRARRLLVRINELGLPAATEFLDPIVPQYIADLISWAAIGARTTESQTHREMASGLSMPVGFKNSTDGNLDAAVNALVAARAPQSFLGIDSEGRTAVVKTSGNPWGHVVLRGGSHPNYDPISIEETRLKLIDKELPEAIIIDCSHANCKKKFQGQPTVFKNVVQQRIAGNDSIIGLMLESNINEGSQKFSKDPSKLRYGVSITDECISWETTESLVTWAWEIVRAKTENPVKEAV